MTPLHEALRTIQKAHATAEERLHGMEGRPGVNADAYAELDNALIDISDALDDALGAYARLIEP